MGQIGGYRVSSDAQRKLQRVTRRRWPLAPDRRLGALTSGWLAAALNAPIVRFCARTVGMQSLIGERLMEVFGLPGIGVARPGVVATGQVADQAVRARVPKPARWALYFLAG